MSIESPDVLSNMFQDAQLQSWDVEEASFPAPWGIRSDGGRVHFYCLIEGACRFEIDGVETATILDPGDLVVIMQQRGHCLRDGPHSATVPIEQIIGKDKPRMKTRDFLGKKDALTRLVYGYFLFDRHRMNALLAALPPFVHLKGMNGKVMPWLDDTLRLLMDESGKALPGRRAIADRLVQVMFIHTIRLSLTTLPDGCCNLFAALVDPDIGQILGLIHAQPELSWTVTSMAEQVCLSRSVFAARFKTLVSKSPIQYLLECRMQKACVLLSEGRYSIKEIAGLVGYATAAAFSNSFKRWSGKSPGYFRHGALNGADSNSLGSDAR
jgi:AraC-like DNA-binding protein